MPFSFAFSEDGRTLTCAGSGVVTAEEVAGALLAWLAQPERFRPVARIAVTFDPSAELRLSATELQALVRLDERLAVLSPRLAVAVVAPGDLAFGVSRMWEAYASGVGWRTRVFRSREDAAAWLAGLGLVRD